jgi:nondiscriminating aspartyl-tRNA synthetase
MERIKILEAKKKASGRFKLAGFVQNIRLHKGIAFIELRDISGVMQLVLEESKLDFSLVNKINLESVIEVIGELQEKPAKKGSNFVDKDYELLVEDLKILSLAQENLPIGVLNKADNEAGSELRFNWRFLDLRQADKQMIFKAWTKLEEGMRNELIKNDFIQIYTPALMSTASESGAEVFEVKYFDRKAYLAQSPQFYKQMAMAAGLERVFVCGPVFRAEPSFTNRHLTEFTGWDFEMSYINSIEEIMAVEEKLLIAGFEKLKNDLELEIELPQSDFPKITFSQVKNILKERKIESEKEFDLSPLEEREISKYVKEKYNHDFLFITYYPIEARPFYHMQENALTKSFDLLYQGIEITTGAQREHRSEFLIKQAKEKEMDLDSLQDYINFFNYGCPPHGGIGMGPGRLIMKILNFENIKEVSFLPRDVKRLKP